MEGLPQVVQRGEKIVVVGNHNLIPVFIEVVDLSHVSVVCYWIRGRPSTKSACRSPKPVKDEEQRLHLKQKHN